MDGFFFAPSMLELVYHFSETALILSIFMIIYMEGNNIQWTCSGLTWLKIRILLACSVWFSHNAYDINVIKLERYQWYKEENPVNIVLHLFFLPTLCLR